MRANKVVAFVLVLLLALLVLTVEAKKKRGKSRRVARSNPMVTAAPKAALIASFLATLQAHRAQNKEAIVEVFPIPMADLSQRDTSVAIQVQLPHKLQPTRQKSRYQTKQAIKRVGKGKPKTLAKGKKPLKNKKLVGG